MVGRNCRSDTAADSDHGSSEGPNGLYTEKGVPRREGSASRKAQQRG